MYRNIPILYRILESFFRYRTLFLISTIIITVLPAAFLLTRKPTYTSTALVQVVTDDVSRALGDTAREGVIWVSVAQQSENRFNEWMSDDSSGGFVELALQEAHLSHPIIVDPRAKDERLSRLRKGLTVATTSDSVFSITLVWDNAAECEQITKALEAQYIERTGLDREAQSLAVVRFLDGELEKYAARLKASEQAVIDFKKTNGGQSPEAFSATINQLSDLNMQLNNLEITSHNNDLRSDIIQRRISKIKPTSVMETRTTNRPVQESPLVIQQNELQRKRMSLIFDGWLSTSTRVQALDAQIKLLQQDIDAEVKANPNQNKNLVEMLVQDNPEYRDLQNQLNTAAIEKSTDQAQIAQLKQRIGEYEARIERLPLAESKLNDRMRDFNILKTEYEDLLKRREQARLKSNLDKVAATAPLHGIGTIYAQTTNTKAKTTLMLAGLLIIGLIIGLAVTFLAEWADPSVRFASDVQRRLGVPVLISLPELAPLRMVTSSPDGETSGDKPLLPARNE